MIMISLVSQIKRIFIMFLELESPKCNELTCKWFNRATWRFQLQSLKKKWIWMRKNGNVKSKVQCYFVKSGLSIKLSWSFKESQNIHHLYTYSQIKSVCYIYAMFSIENFEFGGFKISQSPNLARIEIREHYTTFLIFKNL